MLPVAEEYFINLTSDAGAINVEEWEKQIQHAEDTRSFDISKMDIMGAQAMPRAENSAAGESVPTEEIPQWISVGLDIEDAQYVIAYSSELHSVINLL